MSAKDSDGIIPIKLYVKDIDGDNQGIFCMLKRGGSEYTEVRLYPAE